MRREPNLKVSACIHVHEPPFCGHVNLPYPRLRERAVLLDWGLSQQSAR